MLAVEMRRSDFDIVSLVGEGYYAKVFMVRKKDTRRVYAMKMMQKELIIDSCIIEKILLERTILSRANHPYILKLHFAFQSPQFLHLISDFANGGDLWQHWADGGKRFPEPSARFYAAELYLAISHLHACGILHRDLKLENVLLDCFGHVALTDFGLSKQLTQGEQGTSTVVGTYRMMPPEMLRKNDVRSQMTYDGEEALVPHSVTDYTKAVDWWSYGIMVFEMLFGKHPFIPMKDLHEGPDVVTRHIREGEVRLSRRRMSRASSVALDFAESLLEKDPAIRLGYGNDSDIRNHAFFSEIDWESMMRREVSPTWVPDLAGETDLSHFAPEVTSQSIAQDSEVLQDSWPLIPREDIAKMIQPFQGFDYSERDSSQERLDPFGSSVGGSAKNDVGTKADFEAPKIRTERRRKKRFVAPEGVVDGPHPPSKRRKRKRGRRKKKRTRSAKDLVRLYPNLVAVE